jgi:hypothetical protein
MSLQIMKLGVSLLTYITSIWLLSCVSSHMYFQMF